MSTTLSTIAGWFFDALYQEHVVRPRNLGNKLLPIWESRQLGNRRSPNCRGRREGARVFVPELHHELDVSLGETLHVRQFIPQFAREPGNNGGAPALVSLGTAQADGQADAFSSSLPTRGSRSCARRGRLSPRSITANGFSPPKASFGVSSH